MDEHDADVFELVKRYGQLEFDRGQVLADIAIHLKLRSIAAVEHMTPASIAPAAPKVTPLRLHAKRADMRGAILRSVDEKGPRTVKELAEDVTNSPNNVRSSVHKMVAQGLLTKDGKTYRRQHQV